MGLFKNIIQDYFSESSKEERAIKKQEKLEELRTKRQKLIEEVEIKKHQRIEEKRKSEEYVHQIMNGDNMPIMQPPSGTIMKKNENCHLAGECIYISEQSAGVGYGGARVRVSNNITLNGGNARKVTQQVKIKGYFVITNQRFMFVPYDNNHGFNINLNKIESYQFYIDGLLVRTSNKNYMLNFNKKDKSAIEPVFMGALANIN